MGSTLFIIGNGFDLNCGMKTRYIDAYKEYVKIPSESDSINKFKKEIKLSISETVGEYTDEENINWSDFEVAMSKYLLKCKDENEFIDCLRDFKVFLVQHLRKEEDAFKLLIKNTVLYKTINEEMNDSLRYFYKDINENITREMDSKNAGNIYFIDYISFNYTNVFDSLITNLMQKKWDVHHINGGFEDCALGMDNLEQITSPFFLSNRIKRDFIKTIFNDEYDKRRISIAMEKIKTADTICLFGVSLGDSDISWRNALIEWLKENSSNHLFIYMHRYEKIIYRVVPERMEIEEEAKKQKMREWGINEDDEIITQIHIPIGKNIFNVRKAIDKTMQDPEQAKKVYGEILSKS